MKFFSDFNFIVDNAYFIVSVEDVFSFLISFCCGCSGDVLRISVPHQFQYLDKYLEVPSGFFKLLVKVTVIY